MPQLLHLTVRYVMPFEALLTIDCQCLNASLPVSYQRMWHLQVCLGPLQAQAQAALAGASSAVITPGLTALTAQLASPPPEPDAAATAEYAALIASECLCSWGSLFATSPSAVAFKGRRPVHL